MHITLIDKSDAFMFGFSKLDVMFGRRQARSVEPVSGIDKPGVEFRQETVTSIDPEHRRVVTDVATYDADILVVALGADYDVAATPGSRKMDTSSTPSPAPSEPETRLLRSTVAPSSWACSVRSSSAPERRSRPPYWWTTTSSKRGLRESSTIHLVSPMPAPIPISQKNVVGADGDPRGARRRVLARIEGDPS